MSDGERPLRIAYLTYRGKAHVGGQGVYTRYLTKALVNLGHHVEVYGGQPYPILDERVTLHQLPSLDIFNDQYPGRLPAYWEIKHWTDAVETAQFMTGTFSEPLAFSLRVNEALKPRTNDFDIVHDNQCLGYGIIPIEKRIPTLVTLHHPISKDRALELSHAKNFWERWGKRRWYAFVEMQARVARKMPRIVVVSENSIQDIHTDFGVDLDKMRLVRVGVDPEMFKPLPHVQREENRLITTASADVPLKGLQYLLDALAKLRTERDVRLTIIGKPRKGTQTSEQIERLGLTDAIDWVSGVPDERIVELYNESTMAVVPSLYEGFSLPAVEAMATGCPLVATDGGALPEVTGTDGDTVISCIAGDADALAAAIRRGLDSPELRARVGKNGRERVIHKWTWDAAAVQTVEQYREVIAMRAHASGSR
jgi:glycosyltransferase involved in cell wall biosynthesis